MENRSRLPALVQRIELPLPAPVGWEYWGYLNSKAYTRDTWMHRIDISQATGRALEPSADHEGLIVADLVPDCSKGKIPGLMPTGQAGGIFGSGNGPSYDAIAFCQGHRRAGNLGGNHAGCIVVLDLLPSLKPWLKQLLPAVACPVRTRETSRLMMATTAGRMDV